MSIRKIGIVSHGTTTTLSETIQVTLKDVEDEKIPKLLDEYLEVKDGQTKRRERRKQDRKKLRY